MRTMTLCKTCGNKQRIGNGLYCGLTGKSCLLRKSLSGESCVNYVKPEHNIATGLEINFIKE